jgi:AraC-like DNA-binding protein
MTDPVLLEAMARGVAIGGFAATAVAMAASRKLAPLRWIGALLFICAIGHVLYSWSGLTHPGIVPWALSVTAPGVFWLFAMTLLNDEPAISPWRFAPPLIAFGLWALGASLPQPFCFWIWKPYSVFAAGLVIHVLAVAWRGWRSDLVDQRRHLRAPLSAAAAGYMLIQALCDFGLPGYPRLPAWVQALVLAGLGLGAVVALLRVEPELVLAPTAPGKTPQAAPIASLVLGPADRLILVRLDRAMTENEVWRDEALSIGTLAALVGAPEHRLRKLINGTLGHRNFADYVNSRRIEAAKIALSDPELALKSVSAVAYDLGFGSLGPFNRAFRAETGSTPTAWRQQACGAPRLRLVESGDPASNLNKSA